MEEKEITNAQVFWTGFMLGVTLFVAFFLMISCGVGIQDPNAFNNGGMIYLVTASIVLGWSPVVLAVFGAFIGKSRKNTKKTMWNGAFLGAIIGSSLWIILSLLNILPGMFK